MVGVEEEQREEQVQVKETGQSLGQGKGLLELEAGVVVVAVQGLIQEQLGVVLV